MHPIHFHIIEERSSIVKYKCQLTTEIFRDERPCELSAFDISHCQRILGRTKESCPDSDKRYFTNGRVSF